MRGGRLAVIVFGLLGGVGASGEIAEGELVLSGKKLHYLEAGERGVHRATREPLAGPLLDLVPHGDPVGLPQSEDGQEDQRL